MKFKAFYQDYIPWFDKELKRSVTKNSPNWLYLPVKYVLEHSGKQLRPALLAASADAFSGISYERSFPAASCIEMIHNFTLIHDDIMDGDTLRHGEKTVHEKWDINKAILAGDGLFSIALSQLDGYADDPLIYASIVPKLLDAVIKVCEGQALDMEFEIRENVLLDEYVDMVRKKTASLLATAGRVGAIIGGASIEDQERVEQVLFETGIVFQIQDDLLELTSNAKTMGKTLGSDLVKRKKTYPYLFAKQEFNERQWDYFQSMIREDAINEKGIDPVCDYFEENFIFDRIREVIKLRHDTIQEMIKGLPTQVQEMFYSIIGFIMHREK